MPCVIKLYGFTTPILPRVVLLPIHSKYSHALLIYKKKKFKNTFVDGHISFDTVAIVTKLIKLTTEDEMKLLTTVAGIPPT